MFATNRFHILPIAVLLAGLAIFAFGPTSTLAQEGQPLELPCVTVVLNNGSYRVLKLIVGRMGGPWNDAKQSLPGLDFETPRVDFAAMAKSMGLDGERVAKTAELRPALERAFAAKRPYVVDVLLDQPGEDA